MNKSKKIFSSLLVAFLLALLLVSAVIFGVYEKQITALWISVVIIYVLDLGFAFYILCSRYRNQTTKTCWIFAILGLPMVGIILFLIFGTIPFVIKNHSYAKNSELVKFAGQDYSKEFVKEQEKWTAFKYNLEAGKSPIYKNNKIKIIKNNSNILQTYIELIKSAKKLIIIQTYIIKNGVFFSTVANELIKKAQMGVKVYFMYDWVGSYRKFNNRTIRDMIDSGIEVVIFNPKGLFPYKSLSNFRNHEKLLIIDNEVALYGSANIADEYIRLNTSKTFFTDIQYIIKGQIVTSLATNFFANYNDFSNAKKHFKDQTNKHLSKYLKENKEHEGNNPMQLVIGAPNYSTNNIANTIKLTINAARKSIKIICPFFSPTDDILSCIYAASMRGVKVEIILPSKNSETIYALTMNRSLYSNLLKNNIKVYEHYSFIHAKLMIFDDELVMFGSNNLDYRSLIINFENAILFEGKKNVKEFVELFDKILEQTKTVDEKYIKKHYTLKNKILSKLLLTYKPLI